MSFIKQFCMLSLRDMVVIKIIPVRARNSLRALNICLEQPDIHGYQAQNPRNKQVNIYRMGEWSSSWRNKCFVDWVRDENEPK